MNMKTISHLHLKRFLVAASVALAVPLTAAAFPGSKGMAHGGCDGMGMKSAYGHHGMGGDFMPRHLSRLDLTEAQRDRIFDLMHVQAPIQRNAAKALAKAQGELRALASASEFSETRAKELVDAVAAASAELTLNRVRTERQVFEVLTPEQRKQLADLKAERPRQRGEGPRGSGGDSSRQVRGA
jgi:periplasmic protein CpxP/Spy